MKQNWYSGDFQPLKSGKYICVLKRNPKNQVVIADYDKEKDQWHAVLSDMYGNFYGSINPLRWMPLPDGWEER